MQELQHLSPVKICVTPTQFPIPSHYNIYGHKHIVKPHPQITRGGRGLYTPEGGASVINYQQGLAKCQHTQGNQLTNEKHYREQITSNKYRQ